MSLGQGAAMIIAGAAAQHYAPGDVIAATGVLGVVAAISVAILGRTWHGAAKLDWTRIVSRVQVLAGITSPRWCCARGAPSSANGGVWWRGSLPQVVLRMGCSFRGRGGSGRRGRGVIAPGGVAHGVLLPGLARRVVAGGGHCPRWCCARGAPSWAGGGSGGGRGSLPQLVLRMGCSFRAGGRVAGGGQPQWCCARGAPSSLGGWGGGGHAPGRVAHGVLPSQ